MPYRSLDSQRAYQRAYRLAFKKTRRKRSITLTHAEDRLFARRANDERIRTMHDDRAIFITANKEPIRLKTKPYFKQRKFQSTIKTE